MKILIAKGIFLVDIIQLNSTITSTDTPEELSLRIFFFTQCFASYVYMSIYCAFFTGNLATTNDNIQFKNLEEFSRVGSHKLAVFNDNGYYEYVQVSIIYNYCKINKYLNSIILIIINYSQYF